MTDEDKKSDASPEGRTHWLELNTWEPEKAKAFYAATLGWTFDTMPVAEGEAPYILCRSGAVVVAGIFTYTSPMFDGAKDFWLPYLVVADVDACSAAVEAGGGRVRRAPFDIPDFGRVAVLDDALGATQAWITPAR